MVGSFKLFFQDLLHLFFLQTFSLSYQLQKYCVQPYEFLIFLGLAVVSTVFGHTLWNWALKYVDTAVVGISLLAEPIGSILLAMAIFQEFPHPIVVLGGALVLVGIYLAFRENSTHHKNNNKAQNEQKHHKRTNYNTCNS